jgi:proline dehydrogenase
MEWNALLRTAILLIAGNPLMRGLAARYGMKLGAGRFVAAETLEGAVAKVRELNALGLFVTMDYLGESVRDRALAELAASTVVRVLDTIERERLNSNISVKLTQLGLAVDPELCARLMERICARAEASGNFVRIDMEDSSVTQRTIDIFKRLLSRFGQRTVGLVIQAYLYRSEEDVNELGKLDTNLRIVKGAYKEKASIAFSHKSDVDQNYVKLAKKHLSDGCYTAIATHDPAIVSELKEYAEAMKIPRSQYEFQMLYGIAEPLQAELAEEGYRVRVYTPFGRQWYPYFTRRIAERPANLLFVLKHLLQRK